MIKHLISKGFKKKTKQVQSKGIVIIDESPTDFTGKDIIERFNIFEDKSFFKIEHSFVYIFKTNNIRPVLSIKHFLQTNKNIRIFAYHDNIIKELERYSKTEIMPIILGTVEKTNNLQSNEPLVNYSNNSDSDNGISNFSRKRKFNDIEDICQQLVNLSAL